MLSEVGGSSSGPCMTPATTRCVVGVYLAFTGVSGSTQLPSRTDDSDEINGVEQ